MNTVLQTILTTSFHGSIVILAVLLLRLVLRKAPKKFICMLWMLAGIRLLLPIPIESAYSLQPQGIQIAIPANLRAVCPGLHQTQNLHSHRHVPGDPEADSCP